MTARGCVCVCMCASMGVCAFVRARVCACACVSMCVCISANHHKHARARTHTRKVGALLALVASHLGSSARGFGGGGNGAIMGGFPVPATPQFVQGDEDGTLAIPCTGKEVDVLMCVGVSLVCMCMYVYVCARMRVCVCMCVRACKATRMTRWTSRAPAKRLTY